MCVSKQFKKINVMRKFMLTNFVFLREHVIQIVYAPLESSAIGIHSCSTDSNRFDSWCNFTTED